MVSSSGLSASASLDGPVVVLDNGAGSIKCGLHTDARPLCFQNVSAKSRAEKFTRFGEDLEQVKDVTGMVLRRPFDRGFLSNSDLQKDIWESIFRKQLKIQNPIKNEVEGLLLTEPVVNLPACQSAVDEIVFEEFGFKSYLACPSPLLAARHHFNTLAIRGSNNSNGRTTGAGSHQAEANSLAAQACMAGTGLVLDLGYSFTNAVPIFDNRVVNYGVKRLDFGGKAATNLLREVVSHRSLNVMNEPYVVERMKEETCFISQDSGADLRLAQQSHKAKSPFSLEYVLPDGFTVFRPYIKKDTEEEGGEGGGGGGGDPQANLQKSRFAPQIVNMNHERFMVPEVYFNPSDVGMNQAGIAELVMQSCESLDPSLTSLLLSNVVVVGGSSLFPGFVERLKKELRRVSPIECEVNVHHCKEGAREYAWHGGKWLVSSGEYKSRAISKQEYEENGSSRPFHR